MGESLYPVSEYTLFPLVRLNCAILQGEVYTLQFRFDPSYPISSPAVQFVVTDGKEAPVHPVRSVDSALTGARRPDTVDTIACLLKWSCECAQLQVS
jgi:hypothetical protein